jgi:methionyl-tRNA formyltransferase
MPDQSVARFVYFGTPYVARDTLALLMKRGLIPDLVVSSPDAPKGRGLVMTPSETKALAAANGIPVITPEKLDEAAVAEIAAIGAELGICVAYGKLLPEPLISAFPKGILNIHYSLLPSYRGASPVESALLAGETATGVAIQKMVREMDAGDVVAMQEVAIGTTETTRELRPRLINIGAQLLADILPKYLAGELPGTPQDHARATRAKKIQKADGELDLAGDALANWNKYRAYAESPGTFFYADKNGRKVRVKIKTARYVNGAFTPDRIVPEGKSETSYADFIRG